MESIIDAATINAFGSNTMTSRFFWQRPCCGMTKLPMALEMVGRVGELVERKRGKRVRILGCENEFDFGMNAMFLINIIIKT